MTDLTELRKLAKRLEAHNLDGTGSVRVDVDCQEASEAILSLLDRVERAEAFAEECAIPVAIIEKRGYLRGLDEAAKHFDAVVCKVDSREVAKAIRKLNDAP